MKQHKSIFLQKKLKALKEWKMILSPVMTILLKLGPLTAHSGLDK